MSDVDVEPTMGAETFLKNGLFVINRKDTLNRPISNADRLKILELLNGLQPDSAIDTLMMSCEMPDGIRPSRELNRGDRSLRFLEWCLATNGCGLPRLLKELRVIGVGPKKVMLDPELERYLW